jgi:hypothetical protein
MDILDAIKVRKEEALRVGLLPYDALPSDDGGDEPASSPAGKKTPAKY